MTRRINHIIIRLLDRWRILKFAVSRYRVDMRAASLNRFFVDFSDVHVFLPHEKGPELYKRRFN